MTTIRASHASEPLPARLAKAVTGKFQNIKNKSGLHALSTRAMLAIASNAEKRFGVESVPKSPTNGRPSTFTFRFKDGVMAEDVIKEVGMDAEQIQPIKYHIRAIEFIAVAANRRREELSAPDSNHLTGKLSV